MKEQIYKKSKEGRSFYTIYIIGTIFAAIQGIEHLNWTFQLIKNWQLPEAPFFSKVFVQTFLHL